MKPGLGPIVPMLAIVLVLVALVALGPAIVGGLRDVLDAHGIWAFGWMIVVATACVGLIAALVAGWRPNGGDPA